MASRAIADLSGRMQILCQRHLDRCRRDTALRRRGVDVLLVCTYRSTGDQARLYAQARSTEGPGKSGHNAETPQGDPAAEAYDVLPLLHGKPACDDDIWQVVGEHGRAVGLKWSAADPPHFQNPGWRS